MTAAIVLGFIAGAGLCLVLAGLRPAPVPLADVFAALDRGRTSVVGTPATGWERIVGDALGPTSLGRRIGTSFATDLRITGTSLSKHLASRVALAATGFLWAPVTAAVIAAAGVGVPFALPLWVSLALAPIGFFYPAIAVRSEAADRRRALRHALSAFLDVVSISLAGGRGVDTALQDAASAGEGWAFEEIQHALLEASLLGETPWSGVARLGAELGMPELAELAASASLAGAEGARVRASLAAKARSLRLRGLADIESAAQAASERMSLPVVALMCGFIVFIAYPAVDRVINGI